MTVASHFPQLCHTGVDMSFPCDIEDLLRNWCSLCPWFWKSNLADCINKFCCSFISSVQLSLVIICYCDIWLKPFCQSRQLLTHIKKTLVEQMCHHLMSTEAWGRADAPGFKTCWFIPLQATLLWQPLWSESCIERSSQRCHESTAATGAVHLTETCGWWTWFCIQSMWWLLPALWSPVLAYCKPMTLKLCAAIYLALLNIVQLHTFVYSSIVCCSFQLQLLCAPSADIVQSFLCMSRQCSFFCFHCHNLSTYTYSFLSCPRQPWPTVTECYVAIFALMCSFTVTKELPF